MKYIIILRVVIKIKPILKPQNAFDATKEHEFEFSYPSIISKSKLIVYTNSNGKTVYEQTQTSSKKAYVLPAKTLSNGTYYSAKIYVYDASGKISEESNHIDFYCYSTPILSINITPDQVIAYASYLLQLSYLQREKELLNTYSILIKDNNANDKTVFDSGTRYAMQGLDIMVTGLESGHSYTAYAYFNTVNGLHAEIDPVTFSVEYSSPYLSALLLGQNNKCEGTVSITFNIHSIIGETENGDAIYINGEKIDLRNDKVVFSEGVNLAGDYTIQIDCSDLNGCTTIMEMKNSNGDRVTVEYMEDTFSNIGVKKAYLELKAYHSGVCYDKLSNFIDPPSSSQMVHIWIRKFNNLYDLKFQ